MQVRVYNKNVHPYTETYREEKITIQPGGFVEMEQHEAVMFLGTFSPIQVDGDGNPIAEGYKMLKIEPVPDQVADETPAAKADPLVCLACKYKASSDKDLSEHLTASHADQLVIDEEAEREIVARKKRTKAG